MATEEPERIAGELIDQLGKIGLVLCSPIPVVVRERVVPCEFERYETRNTKDEESDTASEVSSQQHSLDGSNGRRAGVGLDAVAGQDETSLARQGHELRGHCRACPSKVVVSENLVPLSNKFGKCPFRQWNQLLSWWNHQVVEGCFYKVAPMYDAAQTLFLCIKTGYGEAIEFAEHGVLEQRKAPPVGQCDQPIEL